MSRDEKRESNKNSHLSRRSFLGTAGTAAAAFTIVPRHVLGGAGYQAPSDMVNVAGIGVGSRGGQDIQGIADPDVPIERGGFGGFGGGTRPSGGGQPSAGFQPPEGGFPGGGQPPEGGFPGGGLPQGAQERPAQAPQAGESQPPKKLANIYALCDVDSEKAGSFFKGYPKAKIYSDFRKMLDNEKEIDAVVIGTPDHTHAVIASYAMKMGKHVYVEKPMCKTIYEARKLLEIAQEMDVVTQMGNQGHATEGTRMTVEWIQSGAIGLVREVHLSTNRPMWPQGDIQRPQGVPIPDTLDYDIWLGPAPEKPYHPDILHFNWRGLWDYGTGAMGDMGAHIFDAPIWALNLGLPTKIQASSTRYNDEYLPLAEIITYEFPARGYMPPVKVTWVDGGLRQIRPPEFEDGRRMMDAMYLGDKGIIMHGSHGAVPRIVPETAMQAFEPPEPWIPRTGDIYEDWIDAIKKGNKSSNDFKVASHVTEIMLLANIAVLTANQNATLEYDGENMQFTNLHAANDLLHCEYRKGWTL
ncbi:Gfo/Idh/MocA family oxidoreductase [bacterium]|nr:Gfo/Idh/MocA family oxidoreductase [bacterium]